MTDPAAGAAPEAPRRHPYWCTVRWSDMDAYGHVNNVAYLTYLEEARVDMLFVHAAREATEKLASGIVVAHHEIDYRVPLVFRPEPVLIETWVTRLRNASFTLAYEIREPATPDADVVYARASTVLVPFDIAAGRPRRVTEEERLALEPFLLAPQP